jgi:hypothetical protein
MESHHPVKASDPIDPTWEPCLIKWLSPQAGGRLSVPRAGTYSGTALFFDRDVWDYAGEGDVFSVQIRSETDPQPDVWESAEVRLLVEGARGDLSGGLRFWLVEGFKRVALGEVTTGTAADQSDTRSKGVLP